MQVLKPTVLTNPKVRLVYSNLMEDRYRQLTLTIKADDFLLKSASHELTIVCSKGLVIQIHNVKVFNSRLRVLVTEDPRFTKEHTVLAVVATGSNDKGMAYSLAWENVTVNSELTLAKEYLSRTEKPFAFNRG